MKDGYAGLSWGFPRGSYLFWAVLRLSGVSWAYLWALWDYLLFGSARALSVLSWPRLVSVRQLWGVSWGCLGLSLAPFGPPFLGPLSQEAARQQESGVRECKEPPKRLPREPKRSPKKLSFRVFFGASFWTPFGTPLRRVSWMLGLSKTRISLGRSFKNAASPRSPPREKNYRKWSKNGIPN